MARRTPIENVDEAFDAAVALLTRKSRTSAEVASELESRGAPAAVIDEVLGKLKSHRHLDDDALADDQAYKLLQGKHVSPERARIELENRGIPAKVVAAAVEAARDGQRDEALCDAALAARLREKPLDPAHAAKEGRALARLGYDEEVVARVLERALRAAATLHD